jgi:hypothetical protein
MSYLRRLIVFAPVFAVVFLLRASTPAWAEEPCTRTAVLSVPSRPTVTNATDTTHCGVVELEYGLERQWPGGGANRDDLSGGLRLGLTHNLDLHWSSSAFLHVMDGSGDRTGFGDSWLGLKYRFLKQTRERPSLGVFYTAKVPLAGAALGLGSGQLDHAISFLASKDVRRLHFDFNVIELLAGRTAASGIDRNTGFVLASWLTVTRRLGVVLEPYGYTALNQGNPAFTAVMLGFNYKVRPRLYLDAGLDVGVTAAAPRKRVFVGITYAIGNVYSWLRPAPEGRSNAAFSR